MCQQDQDQDQDPAQTQVQSQGYVDDDNDSSYGGEESSSDSTHSLTSSIMHYRELHGRTYHKYASDKTNYVAPNDETQNEVLDIGHHMLTLMLDNKLFLAPIPENIHQVLDVGTGTGIWAIDFADEHPSAVVTGTDLSPIQPNYVPPNLKFEIDDANQNWTWNDNFFDFIHLRCLMGSIKDWPTFYAEAFRCMKPGGYIEHLDFDIQFTSDDGSVKPGDTMYEWSKMFIEAGENIGQTFDVALRSRELIEKAGFVDVVEHKYKMPVGPWPADQKWKELGRWSLLHMLTGIDGMQLFLLKEILGWEYNDIQALSAKMKSAFRDRKNHTYFEVTLVYGRKS